MSCYFSCLNTVWKSKQQQQQKQHTLLPFYDFFNSCNSKDIAVEDLAKYVSL